MRTETFQTPGPVRLRIGIPAGSIELETVDGAETRVELDANDPQLVDEAKIELRPRGDGHEVVVEAKGRLMRLLRREEYWLRVSAPHGVDVEAQVASADVEGRGRYGELELNTASGDARFEEVGGEAAVNTASGDIRVKAAGGRLSVNSASGDLEFGRLGGPARVRTASGDVEIGEAASSLTVQTASGDVQVGSIAAGEIEVQSLSGDVDVGIREGVGVWMDVRSMSGEAESDLALEETSGGEASAELRVNSLSGDVRIRRA